MENKLLTALLPWRPVPGFEPSPEAFAPNVAFVSVMRRVIAQLWILVSCTQMRLTDAQRSSFPSEGRRALRRMDAAQTNVLFRVYSLHPFDPRTCFSKPGQAAGDF